MAIRTYLGPMKIWPILLVPIVCIALLLLPIRPAQGKLVSELEFKVESTEIREFNSTHSNFGMILNVSNVGAVPVTLFRAYFYAIDQYMDYYRTVTKGSFILLEGKSKVFTLNFTMPRGILPVNFTYRPPDDSLEYVFPLKAPPEDSGEKAPIGAWDIIMITFLGVIFVLAFVIFYFVSSWFKKGQRKFTYLK